MFSESAIDKAAEKAEALRRESAARARGGQPHLSPDDIFFLIIGGLTEEETRVFEKWYCSHYQVSRSHE